MSNENTSRIDTEAIITAARVKMDNNPDLAAASSAMWERASEDGLHEPLVASLQAAIDEDHAAIIVDRVLHDRLDAFRVMQQSRRVDGTRDLESERRSR